MTQLSTPVIREFQPGDQPAFERINAEWITRYFTLEPKDIHALADPQAAILDQGGRIFFAVEAAAESAAGSTSEAGQVLGCCALAFMEPGVYELAKMGVSEAAQGRGIGRLLIEHVLAEAKQMGARRLYLGSNTGLGAAVHLYRSFGFKEVPPERMVPSAYSRANIHMELFLP